MPSELSEVWSIHSVLLEFIQNKNTTYLKKYISSHMYTLYWSATANLMPVIFINLKQLFIANLYLDI